jgi:hypothetical protein
VYPTGTVRTGDPIFLSLVRQLGVHVNYRFSSTAPHDVTGTEEVLLQLVGQNGWSRSIVLTPPTRFAGDHTGTEVTVDMHQLQSLVTKVAALTGIPSSYSIAVVPQVHITGTVAGHPLDLSFKPAMTFQLASGQLVPQGAASTASASPRTGSTSASGSSTGLSPSQTGAVETPATAPAAITVFGLSLKISLLRWIAIVGLVLSVAATLFFYLRKRGEPFGESYRIQAQYGHLIVPIVAGEDLGWPPVDVASIKALAQLAESGQRLILHSRSDNVDTYLVNDEGTVYRYQVKPSNVVWGDWSETGTPVQAAA